MNTDNRNRWQIRAATLLVFLLGFVAGALALNAYQSWASASNPIIKQNRYDQLFNQLNLTDSQRDEVQQIVGETRATLQKLREESEPRVQEIRGRSDEKLRKILTAEQWQQFQQARDKLRENDKRNRN
ncbi:MAG: Spy/CpxP family protein refolding chaperone [Pyrinomonadaceae bacterium]